MIYYLQYQICIHPPQPAPRFNEYGKGVLPTDCLAVLDAALKDFLAIMGKLQGPGAVTGENLTKNECLLILYYLEAIIILKLLQRPGVVANMTVSIFFLFQHPFFYYSLASRICVSQMLL